MGCQRAFIFRHKNPALMADLVKVPLFNPFSSFAWVPSTTPAPEGPPDFVVNSVEYPFGRSVSVIVCPPPDNGVENSNQRQLVDSCIPFDYGTHLGQERLNVLLGRFSQHPIPVASYVLAEKI